MRVGIVDYGAGNLASVANAIYAAGGDPIFVRTPEEVLASDRLILPGVGAAGAAMKNLRALGLDVALRRAVRDNARPMLGICLGMQLIARKLHEFGEHEGLGWIDGEVRALSDLPQAGPRIPHMGWNAVTPLETARPFLDRVKGRREFYFCHSYTLVGCQAESIAARTEHGAPLVAAVRDGTVFATQFHPEKSQINGQRLIEAFLDWAP
jgi:imidazole glycerol-phosphate synthase subunit HisH